MSTTKILWFVDRFGIPGAYKRIFVRLLGNAGLSLLDVTTVNLHAIMSGTLLEKIGNRKAPTWVPSRELEIVGKIGQLCAVYQPKVVVISAPKALCLLNLKPEMATLINMRGGVYFINHPIPGPVGERLIAWTGKVLVTLPISAWHTHMRSVSLAGGREIDMIMAAGEEGEDDSANSEVIEDYDSPESDTDDDTESDVDKFRHEPMIVPVGRMMLRFDYMKLGRLVNDKLIPDMNPKAHDRFYLGEWTL